MTELHGSSLLLLDALSAQEVGDWERVSTLAGEAASVAEAANAGGDLTLALVLAGEAAFRLGCLGDAREHSAKAESLAGELGNYSAQAAALVRLAELDVLDADLDSAEQRASSALALFMIKGDLRATLAVSPTIGQIAARRTAGWSTFPPGDDLASRFAVDPTHVSPEMLVNVGLPLIPTLLPYNGVRIQSPAGHSGWIVWTGRTEEMAYMAVPLDDFLRACPEVSPYLGLATGWRFQIAPGYEDVWFDDEAAKDMIGE